MTKTCWLVSLIIPLACASCVSDLGGEDEEHEDEPSASSADELRSPVSCAAKSATGYSGGSCDAGQWYRGVANGKNPYGTCSSTHAN